MISWYWLIPAAWVGAIAMLLVMGLGRVSRDSDRQLPVAR